MTEKPGPGAAAARLVVVGCGTVVPDAMRGGSSYYLELGGSRVLLDCGPAATQSLARHGLPWSELTDLVLTHFHADHVGALPALFFAFKHGLARPRSEPLTVWGPAGTRRLFEGLAGALGEFLLDPGFPMRIVELPPDAEAELSGGVRLRTHKTPHTDESLAVRVDGSGVSVGYTGDTGPSETLGPFFRGSDLLVIECSLLDEEVGDNHLSPARVARIASDARPGVLVLTHVYPHLLESVDVVALVRAAGYAEGRVLLARDGLEHLLTHGLR